MIQEIGEKIKQTIVLSHNESFLWEIYKEFDSGKRKALRINQDFLDDNSLIEPLDLEFLVENEYFVHITELENWLKKPDIRLKERILGLIRNILESHLKFKLYRQLKHITKNKQTFGICIEELDKSGIAFRDNTNRKSIISSLRQLNAISCGPHHGESMPDTAYRSPDPAKITDTELVKFIKTTFQLIDTKPLISFQMIFLRILLKFFNLLPFKHLQFT